MAAEAPCLYSQSLRPAQRGILCYQYFDPNFGPEIQCKILFDAFSFANDTEWDLCHITFPGVGIMVS